MKYSGCLQLSLLLLLLTTMGSATTPVNSPNLKTAQQAYQSGQFPQALALFKPLAFAGDPQAQYQLGLMYKKAQGVRKDYLESAKWLTQAAIQDHSEAQYLWPSCIKTVKG